MNHDFWHTFFNWLGLASLTFAFIAGFGSYFTGREIKEKDDVKISSLESEVQNQKNKIKTFEVRTQVRFQVEWQDSIFDNHRAAELKNHSFLSLFKRGKVVTFETIQIPHFYSSGKNIWTFSALSTTSSSLIFNTDIKELADVQSLKIRLPFVSLKFNEQHKVKIVGITATFYINGKENKPFFDNNVHEVTIIKSQDPTQGYAEFNLILNNLTGDFKTILKN